MIKEKKQLRVYFSDFWNGWDVNNNFFIDLLSLRYKVIIDPVNPELLIYSNHSHEFIKYKSAVKLSFLGENVRPDMEECDFSLSFDYPDYNNRNLRFPLYVIYCDAERLLRPKIPDAIIPEKTHFCNMLVSNKKAKERIEFFHILNKLKQVDSGGAVLNNIGGRVENKLEFIKKYRFTIAFENSSYPGYTTEKIFEPMKMNSIPIYWGSKYIGGEFNPKSFINVHDFSTLQEAAQYVVDIDSNPEKYRAMLNEPWFLDNKLNEYFDTDRVLDFIEHTVMASYPFAPAEITKRYKKARRRVIYKVLKRTFTGTSYCRIQ